MSGGRSRRRRRILGTDWAGKPADLAMTYVSLMIGPSVAGLRTKCLPSSANERVAGANSPEGRRKDCRIPRSLSWLLYVMKGSKMMTH